MKEAEIDLTKTYDAIVVGSGITGGWAAKELCENGMRVLVLEAGRKLDPEKDAPVERDTRLFFTGNHNDRRTGAMWSYPVVQNGLIYVVDIDLGLRHLGRAQHGEVVLGLGAGDGVEDGADREARRGAREYHASSSDVNPAIADFRPPASAHEHVAAPHSP